MRPARDISLSAERPSGHKVATARRGVGAPTAMASHARPIADYAPVLRHHPQTGRSAMPCRRAKGRQRRPMPTHRR